MDVGELQSGSQTICFGAAARRATDTVIIKNNDAPDTCRAPSSVISNDPNIW